MAIEFWLCKMIIRRCQGFAPWLRCDFSVKPLTPDMGRIKIILQKWQVCDWLYHARKKKMLASTPLLKPHFWWSKPHFWWLNRSIPMPNLGRRNLLESSFRHMALRVLKGTEPEDLKKFYEAGVGLDQSWYGDINDITGYDDGIIWDNMGYPLVI